MEYPDADLIVMNMLDTLDVDGRNPYTDTAFPEDSEDQPWEDIFPIVIVQRLPAGGVDEDGLVDRALMSVLCIDKTRTLSQKASRAVRNAILNDGDCWESTVDGTEWLIEPCEEVASPTLEPDFDPDNLFVESTYWVPISLRV